MLIASVIEGVIAAAVVLYLQRANAPILELTRKPTAAANATASGRLRWLWIGLIALIFATPLGLLAPGTAWGEWGAKELAKMGLGVVPQGMAALQGLWGAPLAAYDLPALGNTNLGYVLSAVLGVGLIVAIAWLLSRLLMGNRSQPVDQE
jgi:cobalt/nickel transport system permease protein